MYEIEILEHSEKREFTNGTEAVLYLDRAGILIKPEAKRFNPVMVLNSAVKDGLITYTKDGVEPSMSNGKGGKATKQNKVKDKDKVEIKHLENKEYPSIGDKTKEAAIIALAKILSQPTKQPQQKLEIDTVRGIIKEEIEKIPSRKISIKVADLPTVELDGQHKDFEELLLLLANRQNVWLTGGAGSGKSTAAATAAKAMGVEFYSQSVCAQTSKHEFLGYNDANGNYVESIFFKAFSKGGVFLIDEIDAGNPNVLAVLNGSLDNNQMGFPCGMVDKHKDFIVIAAANTIGSGGNLTYVGRNRIDGATLDRFFMLNWDYDEDFENEISPLKEFTAHVQKIRKAANELNLQVIVSPRISIKGGQMIAAGMSKERVLELMLWNKLSVDEVKQLKSKVG